MEAKSEPNAHETSGLGVPPQSDGLAVMDEIYEAGEEESDFSSDEPGEEGEEAEEEADDEIDPALLSLLKEVQDSGELSTEELLKVPRVPVSKEFANEVTDFLISKGTLMFLAKYILEPSTSERGEERKSIPELLAALGFRLPLSVLADPIYKEEHYEVALQVAIRHTMRHRQRLDSPRTLDELVELINKSQRILVVTGAGISTSLGIPDFRSENGLYKQLEHLGLADPQEVFDIRLFREDPSIFYSVASKILPESGLHSGTPTHKFIKLLHEKNKLLRNYTQNIDNLEQYVGIPHERVVQCHGSFGSAHCITCGYAVPDGESLFPTIKAGEIPRCPECAKRKAQGKRRKRGDASDDDDEDEDDDLSYGVLKPDITFFGEALPARFDHMLFDEKDAENCDLILCMGTSLRVSPVSEIVKVVSRQIPQIYISKTPAKHVNFEISLLGGCDDVIELLCEKLGWKLNHQMEKRPANMSEQSFPGGHIDYDDGVFRFVEETPVGLGAQNTPPEEISDTKPKLASEDGVADANKEKENNAEHTP